MSQGDQSIANQAGAAFRADLNAELQALVTLSSGASAPGTTYARQLWADTSNNLLKRRNAANSAWLVVASLDETFLLSRSTNTILGVSDIGKTINATSTFTQTLTAAATLGDGWWIRYRNNGTGVITLDPNSTETIDGATTATLQPGEACTIVCNGSAFNTIGRPRSGIVQFGSNAAVADGTTNYQNSAITSTSESDVSTPVPFAGVISNLFCRASAAAAGTRTYTLRVNGADSALTCASSGASGSCSDVTHSVTVAAGDVIDLKVVLSGGATTAVHKATVELAKSGA